MLLTPVVGVADETKQDLTKLGLEDLMGLQVTTASKEAQSLSAVPAPIFVITNEDIRRSGALNIPQALRLVPRSIYFNASWRFR